VAATKTSTQPRRDREAAARRGMAGGPSVGASGVGLVIVLHRGPFNNASKLPEPDTYDACETHTILSTREAKPHDEPTKREHTATDLT
jgi:hypothetical protein